MKILILLQSTSGNTRVVARYAAAWMRRQGHAVTIHDIVGRRDPPDLTTTDVLVVACSTMYFRPLIAMEQFLQRLPPLPAGEQRPALQLATCMGEPGAHFALAAEWLLPKGWITLGAHWVQFPCNWPLQLNLIRTFAWSDPLGLLLMHRFPALRPLWGTLWEPAGAPLPEDRERLDRFLARRLAACAERRLAEAPAPDALWRAVPPCNALGRRFPKEQLDHFTRITIHPERCTRCGVCVRMCPVGIIVQAEDQAVPRVGKGCTGCFACYNHCRDHAISGLGVPLGRGYYPGPTAEMRALFPTDGGEG